MTASRAEKRRPFKLAGKEIRRGHRGIVEIPIARLPATKLYLSLPVEVIHGSEPGPRIWLSAAIHGDELNGIEIMGWISDAFGQMNVSVRAPDHGTVIGHTNNPMVRQGDAVVHLATDFE